ncbi:hypothetical protein HK102_013545 [Quaeritorhiza haematococci]|nr:hypothetical protein HK102_013545 [Quaeritorhiza haematococci]
MSPEESSAQYRAIATYVPVHGDEIRLSPGDRVVVLHSYDDGWVLGRNESINAVGLLPANFLVPEENGKESQLSSSFKSQSSADIVANERRSSLVVRARRVSTMKTGDLDRNRDSTSSLMTAVVAVAGGSSSPTAGGSSSTSATATTPTTAASSSGQANGLTSPSGSSSSTTVLPGTAVGGGSATAGSSSGASSSAGSTTSLVNGTSQSQTSSSAAGITSPSSALPPLPDTDGLRSPSATSNSNGTSSGSSSSAAAGSSGSAQRIEDAKKKLTAVNARRAGRAKIPANIGALRISVAGDSGIGKTCLIQSFKSTPEICASEPLPSSDGTAAIREVRASTVPPAELHTGEDPLNLTFIDTPGYGAVVDALQVIRPVVDYHLSQFQRTDRVFQRDISSGQLIRYLRAGTGAHTHVDVCLYGVLHRLTPVDIEYMRRLSPYVNVVPVILKCDTLTPEEVFRLKVTLLEEMRHAKIPMYGFGMAYDELLELARAQIGGAAPFAFSSPQAVAAQGGAPRPGGGVSEFEQMRTCLLFHHVDDVRTLTAEKFVSWRQSAGGQAGSPGVQIPPRGR